MNKDYANTVNRYDKNEDKNCFTLNLLEEIY